MSTPEQQLSESLLAACKAAGIESPRFIAQDANGDVMHYTAMPVASYSCDIWSDYQNDFKLLEHPPYADDWQDSLLEWVEPQGEPLAEVLTQHGDLIGDTTEMVILYDVADTSKKIDMQDAIADAYRKHVERCGLKTYAQTYRQGWQDALAWKAMAEKGGASE
jgi:hypothetical protein